MATLFSPPLIIYIVMGIVIARILLEKVNWRGQTWLEWLQSLVKAGSAVLLWPLMLFFDKVQDWLRTSAADKTDEGNKSK